MIDVTYYLKGSPGHGILYENHGQIDVDNGGQRLQGDLL